MPLFHKVSEKISSFSCLNLTPRLTPSVWDEHCNAYRPGADFPAQDQQSCGRSPRRGRIGAGPRRGGGHAARPGTTARVGMEDRRDGMHERFSEAANPPPLVCVMNPIVIMFSLYFFTPSFFLKLLVFPSCPNQRARLFSCHERGNGILKRQRQFQQGSVGRRLLPTSDIVSAKYHISWAGWD